MANLEPLSKYFDLNVKQQVLAAWQTTPFDKTFFFSGPARFEQFGSSNSIVGNEADFKKYLCPLLFTQSVTVMENRIPGGTVGSLGTPTIITLPSPGSAGNQIQLGGFAVITGDPATENSEATATNLTMKYNLLKRMYYYLMQTSGTGGENEELLARFMESNTTAAYSQYRKIAWDRNDLFTNFGLSEFYEIPFGILSITLSKGNDTVFVRYYEHATIMDAGPQVQANLGAPTSLHGSGGLGIRFLKEKIVPIQAVAATFASQSGSFISALFNYLGYKSVETTTLGTPGV